MHHEFRRADQRPRRPFFMQHLEKKQYSHRLCSICLVFLTVGSLFFVSSPALSVRASQETRRKLQEAQQKRDATKNELSNKRKQVDGLNQQKKSLQNNLNSLNAQLQEVSDNVEALEGQITQKNSEIEETSASLEMAKQEVDQQYASMKQRMRFLFESERFCVMEMMTEADSFSDLLNRSAFIEAMSAYDRRKLEEFKSAQKHLEEEEERLRSEKNQLDDLHVKRQEEQKKVTVLVNGTANRIDETSGELAGAMQEAQEVETQLNAQEKDVAALEAKLKEEIRISNLAKQSAWRDISQIGFEENDRELMAAIIYCEAGSEPYEGKVAVGAVVMNRVRSAVFPNTVMGVLYQRRQFSPVGSGRFALALQNHKATASCYQAADEAMSGYSNVGECVYFRTPIPGLSGISIGGHIFY